MTLLPQSLHVLRHTCTPSKHLPHVYAIIQGLDGVVRGRPHNAVSPVQGESHAGTLQLIVSGCASWRIEPEAE